MKILYAIVLILISGLTFAQEIEMGPTGNTSVFLRLDAMKDSVGDATLSIRRSTSEDAGLIKFSLDDLESFSGLVSSSNWHFGLDGDDHLKFTHFYEDFFSELERKTKVDALVIDATDEGTHKNPIVILPQGKLQIGTEIQLESRTDNSLALLDGDFIPGNSYGIYDLGNNEDDEHWDEVVAHSFISYIDSHLPIVKRKSPNSLNLTSKVEIYDKVDTKSQVETLSLDPRQLLKFYPQAVHTHDSERNKNGEIIETKVASPGLKYMELIPLMVSGMQEQQELIDQQSQLISSLQSRIEHLENK